MITLLRAHAQQIYDRTLWDLLNRERAEIHQARLVAEMAVFNWLWDPEFEEFSLLDPLRRARLRLLILSDFCPSLRRLWGKGHLEALPDGAAFNGRRFYRELGA